MQYDSFFVVNSYKQHFFHLDNLCYTRIVTFDTHIQRRPPVQLVYTTDVPVKSMFIYDNDILLHSRNFLRLSSESRRCTLVHLPTVAEVM